MIKKRILVCIIFSLLATLLAYVSTNERNYTLIEINKGQFYKEEIAFNGIYGYVNNYIKNKYKDQNIQIAHTGGKININIIDSGKIDAQEIANEYLKKYIELISEFEKKLINFSLRKNEFSIDLYLTNPIKIDPSIESIKYVSNMKVRIYTHLFLFIILSVIIYNLEKILKLISHEIKNLH